MKVHFLIYKAILPLSKKDILSIASLVAKKKIDPDEDLFLVASGLTRAAAASRLIAARIAITASCARVREQHAERESYPRVPRYIC